jgi:DNA-binding winged helix-turn-helix (wHTH) protein
MDRKAGNGEGNRYFEFGPFKLDPAHRLLTRRGKSIPLTPKAFDTLMVLVEHSGTLVGKEELIKSVWPETEVEEGNLTFNIHTLRKALGVNPKEHKYILTVPGKGYRFKHAAQTSHIGAGCRRQIHSHSSLQVSRIKRGG